MLLIIQIIILCLLGLVFIQDMRYRAVSWYLFPLLLTGFLSLQFLSGRTISMIWLPVLINICFILMVILLFSLYILLTRGRLVNITHDYLGIADLLFLGVIATYLSVLNFFFFYITSLLCVAILWLLLKGLIKNKYIPLAGLQSLILVLFLAGDWWHYHLRITDDQWLLRVLIP